MNRIKTYYFIIEILLLLLLLNLSLKHFCNSQSFATFQKYIFQALNYCKNGLKERPVRAYVKSFLSLNIESYDNIKR